MFFGAVVKPSQSFKLQPSEGEVLHLSGACLKNPTSAARSFLVISQDGKEHIICALKKDTMENVPLDLFIATRDGVEFKVQGEHEVHLFGYYEPTEGPSDDENDSDDEGDEEQMAAMQKAFQARAALKGAEDDDEDDSDDEDDDEMGEGQAGEEGSDDGEEDEDEDDDEEDEKVAALLKQLAEQGAKKKEKKQAKQVEVVEAPRTDKKRKAVEAPAKGKPNKQMKSDDSSAATQFEKSVVEYLKKHGRTQVSQVASACPKPAAITSKYREFLSTRPSLTLDGNFVSLKQ